MLHLEKYNRDFSELTEEAINNLKENTVITNFSSGSIARALVEVYNDEMDQFYDRLQTSMAMKFVSMASGAYLDEIAKIFNIERHDGEEDDNFRFRIIHATESLAKGNEMAVRLAVLSVDGVHEMEIKKYSRGTGTFDIYLAIDESMNNEEVMEKAQKEVEEVESCGIMGNILEPEIIMVDLETMLTFHQDTSDEEKSSIRDIVERNIVQYINNLYFDDILIVTDLINEVMEVSNKIKDMRIASMAIDDNNVPITNQTIEWNEQAAARDVVVN